MDDHPSARQGLIEFNLNQ